MKKIISLNPATGKKIDSVQASTPSEIKQKVKNANEAKTDWKNLGIKKRIELLRKAHTLFFQHSQKIAELITTEVGTPITECTDEVEWNRGYFEWFLDHSEKILSPKITGEDRQSLHTIYYEPIGTAAVITPWNLPFDLFVWGVIPNLLVGNTVVYKAAEECVLSGKLYAELMNQVDLPKGVFSAIYGGATEGKYLVSQDIDLIWFTGSSEVGKKLYQVAGKKFIKAVLEMGGSNPAIIFDDVQNIDACVNRVFGKRFSFCGQTCDAVKRLLIDKHKFDEVVTKLVGKIESVIAGDPQNPRTTLGPLVSHKQLNLLESQVKDAVKKGANILIGGRKPDGFTGVYYLPTLLTQIKSNMRVWHEEVFGPVLIAIPFSTEEEAINLANQTQYGLGATIFSDSRERIRRVASQIQAGNIEVNGVNHFKPYNPFGGYKASGLGREHGEVGLHELCQIKVVSEKKS